MKHFLLEKERKNGIKGNKRKLNVQFQHGIKVLFIYLLNSYCIL